MYNYAIVVKQEVYSVLIGKGVEFEVRLKYYKM